MSQWPPSKARVITTQHLAGSFTQRKVTRAELCGHAGGTAPSAGLRLAPLPPAQDGAWCAGGEQRLQGLGRQPRRNQACLLCRRAALGVCCAVLYSRVTRCCNRCLQRLASCEFTSHSWSTQPASCFVGRFHVVTPVQAPGVEAQGPPSSLSLGFLSFCAWTSSGDLVNGLFLRMFDSTEDNKSKCISVSRKINHPCAAVFFFFLTCVHS